eukprot:TRINITY_DN3128_c0_g1_i1.p1 TRINITY_DN3128_c0_g1~~TRINITY_DN3128_c0_g1_i1.p1  ORF type:complete len:517 (-),score=138.16 TRINITY_DN3128_c0_g1_i1:70-1593(-)
MSDPYQLPPDVSYLYVNEKEIDQNLKCLNLCQQPLIDPFNHKVCELSFCEQCVKNLNYVCPDCKSGNQEEFSPLKTKLVLNMLGQIPVKCVKCGTQTTRSTFPDHVKVCPFPCPRECGENIHKSIFESHDNLCLMKPLTCPNGCESPKILRKEMEVHLLQCPEQMINCLIQDCQQQIKRKNVQDHELVCPEKVIKCPLECGCEIKRKELKEHDEKICAHKVIECPEATHGCKERFQRKGLDRHVSSCVWSINREIVELFLEKISSNERRIQQLQIENQEQKNKIIQLEATPPCDNFHILDRLDFIPSKKFPGWSLMMRLAGDTLPFDSPFWTNESLLNEQDINEEDFSSSSKYASFNTLPIQWLMIVDQSGRSSVLKVPERKPLLEHFKKGREIPLVYISGCSTPLELIANEKDIPPRDHAWRLNSESDTHSVKVRIGGYFTQTSPGPYGKDTEGMMCSAEVCGAGLLDKEWSPFVFERKSFGVRKAHDNQDQPWSQLISAAFIYAK